MHPFYIIGISPLVVYLSVYLSVSILSQQWYLIRMAIMSGWSAFGARPLPTEKAREGHLFEKHHPDCHITLGWLTRGQCKYASSMECVGHRFNHFKQLSWVSVLKKSEWGQHIRWLVQTEVLRSQGTPVQPMNQFPSSQRKYFPDVWLDSDLSCLKRMALMSSKTILPLEETKTTNPGWRPSLLGWRSSRYKVGGHYYVL